MFSSIFHSLNKYITFREIENLDILSKARGNVKDILKPVFLTMEPLFGYTFDDGQVTEIESSTSTKSTLVN